MIYYGLLVDYLHSMVEGRQPLRTTQRVCNRTRATCGPLNEFQEVHWETFRQGWNTWARRLDIDWKKIFTCDHCGPEPSTIICDGTAIGFRKDFLEHQPSPAATEDLPVVTGSRHSERVFIDCAKSRRLLLRYSGKVSSGKSSGKSEISEAEMKDLQDKLDRCGRSDVTTVLRRLEEEGHTTHAPSTYSSFLKQLAMSTPVSGMTQIAWDDVAQRIVKRVAEGKVDLTDSSCHKYLGHLQKRAPVLADFVCSVTVAGRIPSDVSPVLLSLMAVLHETFEAVEVPASFPDPTPESPHSSFFPAYSLVCGLPRFAIISGNNNIRCICSQCHSVLTMGKRYYCDFCDRSFPDNLPGRKKHLQGVQHQRIRKLHYDQFRDAAAILADEAMKKPCKKFQRTGECDYGDNCRFSHMTPDKLINLQEQAEADKRPKPEDRVPTLEGWLSKRAQRNRPSLGHTDSSNQTLSSENTTVSAEYSLPHGFPPLHELPPSLHPPPPGGWPDHTYEEWG